MIALMSDAHHEKLIRRCTSSARPRNVIAYDYHDSLGIQICFAVVAENKGWNLHAVVWVHSMPKLAMRRIWHASVVWPRVQQGCRPERSTDVADRSDFIGRGSWK